MKKYIYKAYDSNFNIIKGDMEEEDINTVIFNIKSKGWAVIDIYEKKSFINFFKSRSFIKDEELSSFCGQMAVIVESGISLIKGLEILIEQTSSKKYKILYNKILKDISKGRTLSEGMKDTKKFPNLLIEMIKAGEISGNLEDILYNMEDYFQKEASIKNKIKSATAYPKMLISASFLMIIFFNYFIMPIFKGLFGSDVELPLYTRFLLNSADFINNNLLLVILFIILILIGIRALFKLKKVNTLKDYIVFKIPVYGVVKNYIVIARFTRTLNIFIKSAVPIFIAFDSIGTIVGNEYIATKINLVKNEIMTGAKIADAIEKEKLFEPLLVQMIRIGEETGRMEEMLKRLSEIYDKKLEVGITKLMGMVEPMFTLIIGGFVGSVIIAMAIPILTISQNM